MGSAPSLLAVMAEVLQWSRFGRNDSLLSVNAVSSTFSVGDGRSERDVMAK